MRVILLRYVRKLGKAGEIIDASEGFVRNYLLPNKLAEPATDSAIAKNATAQKSAADREAQVKREGAKLLEKLSSSSLTFETPADPAGHLYAGLKESEILAKISRGDETLQKSLQLMGYHPIKTTGKHEITVNLPGTGSVKLSLSIIPKS